MTVAKGTKTKTAMEQDQQAKLLEEALRQPGVAAVLDVYGQLDNTGYLKLILADPDLSFATGTNP
jgi:hypothetical protein